ncbi:MAG: hypothetical protein ACK4IY_05275 [Chitinophagales bacterium]
MLIKIKNLMLSRSILFSLQLGAICIVKAQVIENVRVIPKGDILEIYYDLKPGIDSLNCNIAVYASHNDFNAPLLWVGGHVGSSISPGDNKLIIWEARKELENFKGQIIIEIQADPIVLPYQFNFEKKIKARRSAPLRIDWIGGKKSDVIDIQLLNKNKEVINVLTSTNNEKTYLWKIPRDFKKDVYHIRLIAPGYDITSNPFKVQGTRKWWLIIPATGGLLLALILTDNKDQPLPLPPGPPSSN